MVPLLALWLTLDDLRRPVRAYGSGPSSALRLDLERIPANFLVPFLLEAANSLVPFLPEAAKHPVALEL